MSVYAAALSPRRVRLERGKCSNLLAVASVGRLAASALLLFLPLVGAPGTLPRTGASRRMRSSSCDTSSEPVLAWVLLAAGFLALCFLRPRAILCFAAPM